MVLRKFKNIYGKKINIMNKEMKPNDVLEFDIPEPKLGDCRVMRSNQEIDNLVRGKYIKEIKLKETF